MIERKNEFKQGAIAACISVAALAGSIICGKAYDYRDTFIPGTIINGNEVAAMTVSEVEEVLGDYEMKVSFRDGDPLTIEGKDIDYHYVPDGRLDRLMEEQSPYKWILGIFRNTKYEIPEKKDYSTEKLLAIFHAVPQTQSSNMIKPEDAFLDYKDGKFCVAPEVDGTTLDMKAADAAVLNAALIEKRNLDLDAGQGIYLAPKVRKDNERLGKDVEQLNELAGGRIVYDLPDGGTRVLDGTDLKDWLEVDDEGDYYRDDDIWEECLTIRNTPLRPTAAMRSCSPARAITATALTRRTKRRSCDGSLKTTNRQRESLFTGGQRTRIPMTTTALAATMWKSTSLCSICGSIRTETLSLRPMWFRAIMTVNTGPLRALSLPTIRSGTPRSAATSRTTASGDMKQTWITGSA